MHISVIHAHGFIMVIQCKDYIQTYIIYELTVIDFVDFLCW